MDEAVSFHDFWTLFWPSILACVVAAGICGLLGFFVVVRRIAFVSSALGQVSGLGIAFGFWIGSVLGHDPHMPTPLWLDPVVQALVLTGVVSAAVAWVSRVQRTSPESTVAFVYLLAAALTLLILASPSIVQEAHEVGDLLFGNSVAVRTEHLVELLIVAAGVLVTQLLFFRSFLFVSFDAETARAVGLPVRRLELLLHISIGLTVAVATRAVGAMPVFGFLVLPAGAALLLSESVGTILVLSMSGAMVAAFCGFYLSFLESWPTGPMMVVVAAAYWPIAWVVQATRKSLRRA
jgi:zinc transport system permease protein